MSPAEDAVAQRREQLLDAALRTFARYGFRRTAMDDIAAEAGVSRPSLYQHFTGKEDVFRALSRRLHDQALTASGVAARGGGPLAERLRAVLAPKLDLVLDIARESPHAAELLDENDRICGGIEQEFRAALVRLLANVFRAAARRGEVDLRGRGLSASDAAALAVDGVLGVERELAEPDVQRRRLTQFATVLAAGLAPGTHPTAARGRAR
jgi:TetR/AcrR family transcriptional regulator